MIGAPRARALPRFLPTSPQLQPAFRCPGSPSAGGDPTPLRVPHTAETATQNPHPPPLFLPSHPPSRLPLPRRNRWFGNVSASPAAGGQGGCGGGGLWPSGTRFPAATPPAPGAPPGDAAPGKGSGLPSAPGAGGSSGDAGARRCPRSRRPCPLAPRYPEPSPARQPSLSAGASLGSAEPRCRAALRSRDWRERVAPLRRPGMRGEGEQRGWGDEETRALPPRPLAHLQAPHAGGAGAGGRPTPRCPGEGAFGGRVPPGFWGGSWGGAGPVCGAAVALPGAGFINMSAGACRGDP